MTTTPISTITSPTTSTAYCAIAIAALGLLISSPASSPGMSPVDSCQGAPSACFSLSLSFLDFFLPGSGSTEPALLSPTIDQAAPAPAGVDTGSIGSGLLSTRCAAAGGHSSSGAGGAG